jgi:hypothetical protein
MKYGLLPDSAVLTTGRKLARSKRKPTLTPAEQAFETTVLVGMFWSMLTWVRFAKFFAVVVLVVGLVLDGFTGLVVAYVLASPIGGFVYLSRKSKERW